jgi:glycosyltransferase involved in cell wall biosynthesis
MRILYLTSSGQLGGAERVLLDLAAALRRSHPEWALHLAAVEPGPFVSAARDIGVAASVLPLPRTLADLGESGSSPGRVALRLAGAAWPLRRYLAGLREHIASVGADIVHSHGLKTHVLAALTHVPGARVVWHVHDYIGQRKVTARLLRQLAGRADLAIANSASVGADVANVCRGRLPVKTVLNGVDVDALSPEGPHLDLDAASGLPPAPPGTVRIGLVATFARWKGHATFLEAVARVPRDVPVRAYIVGGPVYQTSGSQFTLEELTAASARLGLAGRVGFTGFQSDRAAAMRALDVVVHASTAPEPFGLVIAEAMSVGRAVITTAVGGAAELVQPDVDAVIARPGDADDLARMLAQLAASPNRRLELGRAARTTAIARFSRTRFAAEIANAYLQVAAKVQAA